MSHAAYCARQELGKHLGSFDRTRSLVPNINKWMNGRYCICWRDARLLPDYFWGALEQAIDPPPNLVREVQNKKEKKKKQGWSVCILHMLSSQGLEFILTMKNVEYGLFISLSTVFLSSQARMLNWNAVYLLTTSQPLNYTRESSTKCILGSFPRYVFTSMHSWFNIADKNNVHT